MYNIKKGEISIEYTKDKIKIYYCPESLSGDEKLEVIKNIESEYGEDKNYEIHEVGEGFQTSTKPSNISVWLPKLTSQKKRKNRKRVEFQTIPLNTIKTKRYITF